MICKTIRPAECVNPFRGVDSDPAVVTFPDGSSPTSEMPVFFPLPVGSTLEHRDCWMHCVYGTHNAPPIAEPADDECRRMVAMMMERREPAIQGIRELSQDISPASKAGRFVHNLAKAYGVD